MVEKTIENVSKMAPDMVREQVAKMGELFPECITEEGKVDFDKLKAVLGEIGALSESDGYKLTWAGKEEVFGRFGFRVWRRLSLSGTNRLILIK